VPGFVLPVKIKRSQPSAAPTQIPVGAAEGCDLSNLDGTKDLIGYDQDLMPPQDNT
jgi:hypothetical protein